MINGVAATSICRRSVRSARVNINHLSGFMGKVETFKLGTRCQYAGERRLDA